LTKYFFYFIKVEIDKETENMLSQRFGSDFLNAISKNLATKSAEAPKKEHKKGDRKRERKDGQQ
jgi:hypothetical protein